MSRKSLDLLFVGAGELALPSLDALVESARPPSRILTRRLRSGSGDRGRTSPVAKWAKTHEVSTQVIRARDLEAYAGELAKAPPDLLVVVDFGRPLPASVLSLPKIAAVGLHYSLLPKYRGADPIRAAIAAGDKETGVSTYLLEEDMETGPILLQETVGIGPNETYGDVAPRLASTGAGILAESVAKLGDKKKMKGRAQNEDAATRAPRMTRQHRKAPWWRSADVIFNRLRAHLPEHGLHAGVRRRPIEILWGRPMEWVDAPFGSVGTFLGLRLGKVAVLCGDNSVFGIDRVRLEDGEALSASELVYRIGLDVGNTFT